MNGIIRIAAVLGAAGFLAACGVQLENAQTVGAKGSAFEQALYAGYIKLSQAEFDESDYADSDVFALRAIASASGNAPAPEAISARKLPSEKVEELTNARAWLMEMMDKGAMTKMPAEAAEAQVQFDCWMQEQEENIQPKDIAACRSAYLKAMGKLDDGLREVKPMMMKKTEAPAPMKEPDVDGIYILYFDFDSDKLSIDARKVIGRVLSDYNLAKPEALYVEGHTDTSGSDSYNVRLSERRVKSVINALTVGGVPANSIKTGAMGERKPMVSGDNKKELKNRRVEIIFE
jgi:OOP family OmpA-OmpF porin